MIKERTQELRQLLLLRALPGASASVENLFKRKLHQSELRCNIQRGQHPCVLSPTDKPPLFLDENNQLQSNILPRSPKGVENCFNCPIFLEKTHQPGVSLDPNLQSTYPFLTESLTGKVKPGQQTSTGTPCALLIGQIINRCQNGAVITSMERIDNKPVHHIDGFKNPRYPNCTSCPIGRGIPSK